MLSMMIQRNTYLFGNTKDSEFTDCEEYCTALFTQMYNSSVFFNHKKHQVNCAWRCLITITIWLTEYCDESHEVHTFGIWVWLQKLDRKIWQTIKSLVSRMSFSYAVPDVYLPGSLKAKTITISQVSFHNNMTRTSDTHALQL